MCGVWILKCDYIVIASMDLYVDDVDNDDDDDDDDDDGDDDDDCCCIITSDPLHIPILGDLGASVGPGEKGWKLSSRLFNPARLNAPGSPRMTYSLRLVIT